MNTSPPAVAIGPPSAIDPDFCRSGIFSVPGNWPSGTCHAISPVAALTAVSVPHGGGVHGRCVLDRAGSGAPCRTACRAAGGIRSRR